jgi:uncharacterized membrane protein YjgN (DUF898 family)
MLDSAPSSDLNPSTDSSPREYRFEFTGKGSEYFSIWIVNLLLSIITLGIYSAWAKVRREQYFHRNTLLDNQAFDYTGDPTNILKGRVVALIILVIGSTLREINVALAVGVIIAYALLYPWVIVRSLKFRARNTLYRNIAFVFTGTTREAVKVFFWIYLAFLPLIFASIYFGPDIAALDAQKKAGEHIDAFPVFMWWFFGCMGLGLLIMLLAWPLYVALKQKFVHGHIGYGSARGGFDASVRDFFTALLKVAGFTVLTFALIGIVIYAAIALSFPWLLLAAYALLVIPNAAYKTFIVNTTYRHASIGGQRLHADMEIGSYAPLLLQNLLLMIFTLGFAWPWVQVRVARYRCENLALFAAPAVFDSIIGEAQKNPSALGEEAAEFLDFDISL